MAHIKLVPFLIVFMAGVGAASEGQNAEPERSITREILLAALLANNQGEDAWDHDVARDFVDELLQRTAGESVVLDTGKANELAHILANSLYVKPITSRLHPLEQELAKERLLYEVETYLLADTHDLPSRIAAREQGLALLREWRVELVVEHPREADEITEGANIAMRHVFVTSTNPLTHTYRRPVTDDELTKARANWAKVKQSPLLSGDKTSWNAFSTSVALLKAISTIANASRAEAPPKPESLVEIEEKVASKISEIQAWHISSANASHEAELQRRYNEDLRESGATIENR